MRSTSSSISDEASVASVYDFDAQEELIGSTSSRKKRRLSPLNDDDEENSDASNNEDDAHQTLTAPAERLSRINVTRKTEKIQIESIDKPSKKAANTTFAALNVAPWLVASLAGMAIRQPTGIQTGCIPEILKGRDCIGGSRTGSGKTVAFAVPILQKWAEDPIGIFAVILTPTRYGVKQ